MIEFIKRTWPFIKPFWKQGLIGLILSIPLAAIKAGQAYIIKPIFDYGFSRTSSTEDAFFYAGILVAFALVNYPIRFFHFFLIKSVVEQGVCEIREKVNDKFQRLPVSFYSKTKQGELMSIAMNDTMLVSQGFKFAVDLVREPLTAVMLFGVMLFHDWQLTLVILAIIPLFILIFNFTGKWIKYYESFVRSQMGLLNHEVAEVLQGQKIIKAFNLQDFVGKRFRKALDKYIFYWKRYGRVEENAHPLVELVGAVGFAGVVVFAHSRIVSGELTNGAFISFIGTLALIMDPIRKYSDAVVRLNQAKASADRVFSILDTKEEQNTGTVTKDSFEAGIDFENITFSYGEGEVLKDFSLFVKKGERVALVGLSGSGKSTLINLILRLYDVTRGEILIDGVPIKDIKLSSLRSLFSLVSQDIFLFNDTVRENVTIGDTYSKEEMRKALEVSYSSEFVLKLPDLLDTVVGDRGTILSGGQAQRITIARAFLKDTPILLFDEATSALDNESEKIVQAALDKVAGDKTVIAVAHRLSTIQNYDKIVVMKEGIKVEEGTHEELMKNKGEYFKLYQLSQK